MAIHIVIDGYNLIGSEKGLRGDLEGKRNRLIDQLRKYRELKGYPITLVFDGWRSGGGTEVQNHLGGVTVIYSRLGEKADNVIIKLARKMGSGCIVVTSDREVRRAAEGSGAAAVYVAEFNAKLTAMGNDQPDNNTETDFDTDPPEPAQRQGKKGNPRKLSKTERRRRERLKKL